MISTPDSFKPPAHPRCRTSQIIQSLAKQKGAAALSLRSMTQELGDRTFGVLLIILAVFNLVPFVSIIFGPILGLLGLQMILGISRARLPGFVLDYRLPAEAVRTALRHFLPKLQTMERYIRPRWTVAETPIVGRINGFVILILGLILTLPIPMANFGPSLVVILMGLGLLERDGLVQMTAASLGLAAMLIFYLLFFSSAGSLP